MHGLTPPVSSPAELKKMSLVELHGLAEDVRQAIVSTCLRNGGHLGASLGTVELAIALHFVFDSPREPLVWDVGHQAYAHKLLTGRWERFKTLRQTDGISGFLSRDESEHDVFGAGHSSTALSAALAMSYARAGTDDWSVAIVGDGGLTAGVALEAVNNARGVSAQGGGPMLLVLNDNQMSISRNVGALSQIFAAGHTRELFELFGFDYVGPVDGHDLGTLIGTLQGMKASRPERPVILHALTQKGKGYIPAEESPSIYHGVSPLQEKVPGERKAPERKSFSDAFGDALCELAAKDGRIVAITAAMPEGTGLTEFARRFPDRFFDVGIAEPHAVTFAAGLATQGLKPVVAIYSTFLQRALDAVIHDVALQRLGVVFALDRAGLVGADGPTHHGAFDLSYLAPVPHLTLSAPACLADVGAELEEAIASGQPWAIRYPRGPGRPGLERPGTVRWLRQPAKPAVIAVALGPSVARLASAAEQADPSAERIAVVSVVRAKPIAPELLAKLRASPDARLLVLEDGAVAGGFGQRLLAELGPRARRSDLAGYPDGFLPHGAPAALEERAGISASRLAERLRRLLEEAH